MTRKRIHWKYLINYYYEINVEHLNYNGIVQLDVLYSLRVATHRKEKYDDFRCNFASNFSPYSNDKHSLIS